MNHKDVDTKRDLTKVLEKNVESLVNQKTNNGTIEVQYIADKALEMDCLDIKKANPKAEVRIKDTPGSPGQDKVRTYFSVIWHVETVLNDSREQKFTLVESKMTQNHPFLKDANFRLTPLIFVNSKKSITRKPKRLSREQQAKKYRKLLDSGKVKNKATLARKFGVSRAWVTKVLS